MNYGVHKLGNGLGLMMYKCCECFFIVSEIHISTHILELPVLLGGSLILSRNDGLG